MSDKNIQDLYQNGAQESSPLALDNLILAQAKKSCEPNKAINTRQRTWFFSLATAAVVVMSFSVIFNLQHENESMSVQPEFTNTLQGASSDTESHLDNAPKTKQVSENDNNDSYARKSTVIILQDKSVLSDTTEGIIVNKETIHAYSAPESAALEVNDEINHTFLEPLVEAAPVGLLEESIIEKTSDSELMSLTVSKEHKSKESKRTANNSIKKQGIMKTPSPPKSSDQIPLGLVTTKDSKRESKKKDTAYRLGVDLTLGIRQLEDYIKDNKYQKAKSLLNQLKHSYPNYDFTNYDEKLMDY